ncbi:hypothetical protein [Kribbella sindirgiensis]|uniref:Uncharacterized protein n=1 Tax=Kribbella sindirgiensis TaxID=1124744 RepID=A0A4R0JAS2_9ACTN|nr:hypothetical protein [Kribbella sindirgiensis]TCC43037.1 hypothetical protein E0H50_00670 [Kribbella sindirgiensis]
MAGTVSRRAMLGAGLLTLAGVGGAGGYGVGLFLTKEPSLAGTAAPLAVSPTPGTTPTPTPTPTGPPRKVTYDKSPALDADDLSYATRTFTVTDMVRSRISVRVPSDWVYTKQTPPKSGRFTDRTKKRWIRVEAGFTITRPPADSLAARLKQLAGISASQMVKILSQEVEANYATLSYTYVPDEELSPEGVLRHVIVRWVADDTGNCAVEMSSTGLPQDKDALLDVLDHATDSVQRRDTPLSG